MTDVARELREKARELLASGEVQCFIGYQAGRDPYKAIPSFAMKPEDTDKLIWNAFCSSSLSKYLLDFKGIEGKVGISVKGCDSKGIVRLIQDNQIDRNKVVIVGVPCTGLIDGERLPNVPRKTSVTIEASGDGYKLGFPDGPKVFTKADVELARCKTCTQPNPAVADIVLGDTVQKTTVDKEALFAGVSDIEAMSPAQRREFWLSQFSKCIRCYACRNACPACSCRECCFDAADTKWLSKSTSTDENEVFHMTRAFHVAGRCTGCGECDRACPVGIPLKLLNKKVAKDMIELFGPTSPGSSLEEEVPFRTFSFDDPEEFM